MGGRAPRRTDDVRTPGTHRAGVRRLALLSAGVAVASTATIARSEPPVPVVRGILTFSSQQAMRSLAPPLGVHFSVMRALPLGLVAGPADLVARFAKESHALRYTPDLPLTWLATDTNRTIRADVVQRAGFTGKGVTVAVVDTGVDASQPDLVRRVAHNVKVVAPPTNTTYPWPGTYVETGATPYDNSDAAGGHGTFVAGIVASDGSATPGTKGVAPGADLVGYSVGDQSGISTPLLAYDHILTHPEWGIDIVNNSWGVPVWAPFDPQDPLILGAKALHDHGIAVVQSVGNWGEAGEMTMTAHALAPWIIGVGASNIAGLQAAFSSNGLEFDNSSAVPVRGSQRFIGDRLGFYHPTVLAPGEDVLSTCTAGTAVYSTRTCQGSLRASGTSAAAPQVAGVLALLKQARPGLTPDQMRAVLEATGTPPVDGGQHWRAGFGVVDAAAAISLVRRHDFASALVQLHRRAEQRLLAARAWQVPDSTHWNWQAPAAGLDPVNGDVRDLHLDVPAGTGALKVAMTYPSLANQLGSNTASYSVSVMDAAGVQLGITTPSASWGSASALVDLRGKQWAPGRFTLHVVGDLVAGDELSRQVGAPPETTYVRQVTLVASLLQPRHGPTPRRFSPTGELRLGFRADPAVPQTAPVTAEGCASQLSTRPLGRLLAGKPSPGCVSAPFGYATTEALPESIGPARFLGAPLGAATVLGGRASIRLVLADVGRSWSGATGRGTVEVRLISVSPEGTTAVLSGWLTSARPLVEGPNEFEVTFPPVVVASGLGVGLELMADHSETTSGRLLFDGVYGNAGVTLTTGTLR
jgi:serine protease AprX